MSSSPSEAESLPCPRCKSRDTKFCYFNNYSTTQPRHFCKNCKRYWTAGGSLRNVPVGGGLRKSKKSKLSKHGKDLLSASAEELSNPSHPGTLPIASPTSSAEGVVDEAFATSMMPPLLGVYRPTFDFASEGLDCTPLPTQSHPFHHMNLTQICEDGHGNSLFQNSHYQLPAHNAGNGFHHPQHWYWSMDQAHSNYGEISSEPSQESSRVAMSFSSMSNTGSSTFQRYEEHERRDIKAQRAGNLRQNIIDEKPSCSKQQGVMTECSADEHNHDGVLKSMSVAEDEDELGLGNVINVRHPYDWEQVSEVLIGGTPDFFQMPTF